MSTSRSKLGDPRREPPSARHPASTPAPANRFGDRPRRSPRRGTTTPWGSGRNPDPRPRAQRDQGRPPDRRPRATSCANRSRNPRHPCRASIKRSRHSPRPAPPGRRDHALDQRPWAGFVNASRAGTVYAALRRPGSSASAARSTQQLGDRRFAGTASPTAKVIGTGPKAVGRTGSRGSKDRRSAGLWHQRSGPSYGPAANERGRANPDAPRWAAASGPVPGRRGRRPAHDQACQGAPDPTAAASAAINDRASGASPDCRGQGMVPRGLGGTLVRQPRSRWRGRSPRSEVQGTFVRVAARGRARNMRRRPSMPPATVRRGRRQGRPSVVVEVRFTALGRVHVTALRLPDLPNGSHRRTCSTNRVDHPRLQRPLPQFQPQQRPRCWIGAQS